MAKKISDLTAATTPLTGTELVEIVQSGVSKQVAVDDLGAGGGGGGGREMLTAARTYYVRTDGSDSNNGLSNSSGGAFLTVQKAVDVIALTLDLSGYMPTIQVGDGTYTGAVALKPMVGGNEITIQGNAGTPANVLISTTSAAAVTNNVEGLALHLKDTKLTTTTGGSCITAVRGVVNIYNLDFGACAGYHINLSGSAGCAVQSNYAISGGALAHYLVNGNATLTVASKTITLSGTPNFTVAFLYSNMPCAVQHFSCTFAGTGATGKRYQLDLGAMVQTFGGGASYFPGNSAGTYAGGSQYV